MNLFVILGICFHLIGIPTLMGLMAAAICSATAHYLFHLYEEYNDKQFQKHLNKGVSDRA